MKKHMKKNLSLLLGTMLIVLLFIGCGGNANEENRSGNDAALSVVFVVTGQLGDMSFNDSAHAGVIRMSETMDVHTNVIEIGRDQTRWQPAFEDLAESGDYDIIITNGSNAGELIKSIAPNHPEQNFILFDTELEGDHPNIYAISYLQNEASFLAGIVAAKVTTSDMPFANEENKIGFIGGSEHPIITDFLVGFVEGALSVNPDITVYVSYIGSWDDTARGKETAVAMFNQGVDIIFPAAEQAGLGVIEAALELDKYIIGVDSDQAMLFAESSPERANIILTSVLKEVGNSLVRAVELEKAGELPWGTYESLGLFEDGVGLADNEFFQANVLAEIREAVIAGREAVIAGDIVVTSALNDGEGRAQAIIDSVAP